MFSLFYGLWKHLFSKAEFHVLILGIDKAGKTTLLEKLKFFYSNLEGLPPDRIVPTVGLNIGHIEASNAKLVFWDLRSGWASNLLLNGSLVIFDTLSFYLT